MSNHDRQVIQDFNNNASLQYKTGDTSASQNVTDTETVIDPCEGSMFSKHDGAHDNIRCLEQQFTDNNKKMEQKIDKLTDALVAMQDIITKNGKKGKSGREGSQMHVSHGDSATTIYRNVLQQIPAEFIPIGLEQTEHSVETEPKRISTSSDEGQIDTSDELIELNNSRILSAHNTAVQRPSVIGQVMSDPQLGTSTGKRGYSANVPQLAVQQPGLTRSEQMIKEAEASRAKVLGTPSKDDSHLIPMSYLHSAYVDEEYLVMGSHLDDATIKRIINHEFVDFGKLLPRDRLRVEDEGEQRMELVNKNGMTYWSPISNRDLGGLITSFGKWETAFRVYSKVYTTQYPNRAAELLQYSHVIHTASLTYTWENVYMYDKEFRFHMSKHPQRSWSIILQQAWNLRLKDKIRFDNHSGEKVKGKSKEICKWFNCGKCNLGSAYRYEHRCLECNRFGHGIHICCKKNKSAGGETQERPRVNRDDGSDVATSK